MNAEYWSDDVRFSQGDEPPPPVRIAITGAAGRVGYGLVFQIASGALFGFRQSIVLSLLERPESLDLLHAMQMELQDCAFPLLQEVRLSDDPQEALADADWIVMLAGESLDLASSSRLDLVRANGPIYVEHGRAINLVAARSRILVVAEPCNTNCRIAMNYAPNVPPEHWFALNCVDRMRATAVIAEKARVPVSCVNRVTVWGNHSEKTYVDFHNAYIGSRPAREVIDDPDWARSVLEPAVAHRDAQIHRLSQASPSATAAEAILGTIRSITTPTPYGRRFGASVRSDGNYGIPHGLIFGFPLRTEDGRTWSVVDCLYLDEYANQRLAENVEELEREAVVADL